MATLAEILEDVQDIVPQPDRERLIRRKINAAINYISRTGFYPKDHTEAILGVADGVVSTALTQTITIPITQRAFSYISSVNTDEDPISIVEPELIVQTDCKGLSPIAYISGTSLIIKHEQYTDEFKVGYYTTPDAFATDGSEDTETNWILSTVPELVVDFAAAYILNLIGQSEDSKRINDFAGLLKGTYVRDLVTSHIGS